MKGAIIGDIIGSIYEFDNIKTKDFPLFGKKCFFTDDSVMTVAIADALLSTRGRDDDTIRDVMQMRMRRYGQAYPGHGYGGHYLQDFDSMEHFKAELIDYLDYYNNRRIKLKLKGLTPAQHRYQALQVA